LTFVSLRSSGGSLGPVRGGASRYSLYLDLLESLSDSHVLKGEVEAAAD
jgi:hypothetical protein